MFSTGSLLHVVAVAAALVALSHGVAAQSCSSYQQLQLYYDTSAGSCSSSAYYFWGNGTCYSEATIYFSVDGETWGTGLSAMFIANYDDPAASTWSYFDDNACQKRLHGIDGLSCESCISNPSGWILSIGSDNITGFNIVNTDAANSEGHVSHVSNRRQGLPRRSA